jgi:hypothetical protein
MIDAKTVTMAQEARASDLLYDVYLSWFGRDSKVHNGYVEVF